MSEHDPTLPDRPIFRTQGASGRTLSLLLLLLFSFTNTGMAATVDSLETLRRANGPMTTRHIC